MTASYPGDGNCLPSTTEATITITPSPGRPADPAPSAAPYPSAAPAPSADPAPSGDPNRLPETDRASMAPFAGPIDPGERLPFGLLRLGVLFAVLLVGWPLLAVRRRG